MAVCAPRVREDACRAAHAKAPREAWRGESAAHPTRDDEGCDHHPKLHLLHADYFTVERIGPDGDTMSTMAGSVRRLVAVALTSIMFVIAPPARGDGRTTFLADRLRSDDFRVRAQAALALGATNDDAAVQPLCGALSDGNDVVRQAAAAALKRLGKSSAVGCMKARLSVEPSADVKLQLTRAIESLDSSSGGGGGAPRNVANAKFYVSIAVSNNSTGRDGNRISTMITNKLDALGAYQVAPRVESPDAARSVIARRNLKGYYLSVSAELSDTDRGLKALVRIAVFSYPSRDLRGEVAPYAIATGARKGDTGTEDSLLQAVAERAVEQFSQNFQ
jgi:hypothetical protein